MSENHSQPSFSPASASTLDSESARYFTFFNVILALIAMTFIELVMIVLPFHKYVLLAMLLILSLIKFVLVIWYFMHLRWDRLLLTALFIAGLIIGTGTAVALYFLFPEGDGAPGAEVSLVERPTI